MLQRIQGAPAGVDVVKAIGTVSKSDYETVVEPLLDEARSGGRRIRVLCEIGPKFQSMTSGAIWEDLALAADAKVAAVDPQLANHFVRAEVRRFAYDEFEDALAWAAGPGIPQPGEV